MPKRITLIVDEAWFEALRKTTDQIEEGEICEWLAIEQLDAMPCRTCGTDVEPDTYLTELGFCVPCQHAYFEEAN